MKTPRCTLRCRYIVSFVLALAFIVLVTPTLADTDKYTWGITANNFTMNTAPTAVRYIGGMSPNIQNMKVNAIWIRYRTSGICAVALYTGGALDNPVGATKAGVGISIEAFNVPVEAGWNRMPVPEYEWPANTVTWLGFTQNNNIYYTSSSSEAEDFQSARGRWHQNVPADYDETTPLPVSIGDGYFDNYWYPIFVEYTIEEEYPVLTINNGSFSVDSSGLVGYWKFDESVGNEAHDSSGYKNDGVLRGGSSLPSWATACPFETCLEFDTDEGHYVEIDYNDSLLVEDGDFTIEARINGPDAQTAENIYVVSLYDDFGFRVAVGGSDNLGMWYRRSDATTGGFSTGHGVLDESWHYIVVTKSGNSYSFYDNGAYVGGTTLGLGLITQTNPRRIGSWSATYGNFNGTIDEVRIWERALSADEINMLNESRVKVGTQSSFSFSEINTNDADVFYDFYRNGSGNFTAFWGFDEGSGQTVADYSENENYGVISSYGRNLVNNPSFELDKQDWNPPGSGDWIIDTNEKYHGDKSSRFEDLNVGGDPGSENTGNVYIPVTAGQPITISLYSKGQNIVLGAQSWHRALLIGRWINSTSDAMEGYYPDMVMGDGTGTWDWKKSSITYTPPNGALQYRFTIGLRGNATGTLWADAVQIEYGNKLTFFTDEPWESGPKCKHGPCLEFDGKDDYVDLGTMGVSGDELTIMAWFKVDDWEISDGRIISKANGILTPDHWWMLSTIASGSDYRLRFRLKNQTGDTDVLIASSGNLAADVWTHAAAVYDSNNMLLYKDGELVGSMPKTGNIATDNTVSAWVGGNPDGAASRPWDGKIDDLRIYSRGLSRDEIVCHYGNNCSLYGLWGDSAILPEGYYYYTARASGGVDYVPSSLLVPLIVVPSKATPILTQISYSGNLDQMGVLWTAEYTEPSTSLIDINCTLNNQQNCEPFYSGPEGPGGCYFASPQYDMSRDGNELRTVQNELRCTACNHDYPGVCNQYIETFYPLSFEVDLPNEITTVIGEEQTVGIMVTNNGLLTDSYSVGAVPLDPWVLVKDGDQTTQPLDTNYRERVYVGITLLSAEQLGTVMLTVNSTISNSYEVIFFDGNINVRGSYKSLPDFGLFGIFQIMIIAAILVSFLF